VRSERLVKQPKYEKYLKHYTAYKVHDEKNEAKVGDLVEIMETRPLSRTKRWRLVRILKKGEGLIAPIPGAPEEALQTTAPKPEAPPAQASEEAKPSQGKGAEAT
jgi:small subunit ribosomal protein S17